MAPGERPGPLISATHIMRQHILEDFTRPLITGKVRKSGLDVAKVKGLLGNVSSFGITRFVVARYRDYCFSQVFI